jgi:hypothetical protein
MQKYQKIKAVKKLAKFHSVSLAQFKLASLKQ